MASPSQRAIVIVGGGSAGWMAAAALSRFVGREWRIALVESDAIGTVGVGEATIPGIRAFNAGLGIAEHEFLRATGGSYKLGIEFDGWGAPGERYMHAFGAVGRGLGLIEFFPYWQRYRAGGGPRGLWDFAPAAVASHANRFGVPQRPGGIAWAYHFDAALYAAFLRRRAEEQGVVRHEGRIVAVDRDGESGDIAAVTLDDGRRIAGDFFLDCSGFAALLIEKTLGAGFDDWSHWLPCDRALAVPSAATTPLVPYTRATARAAGWQWRIPLQQRTGNGLVYASALLSDDDAAATLLAALDAPALADPRPIRFTTGRRRVSWAHNCVALGLAAGFLEPLESTSIHLIQHGIAELLRFLPGTGGCDHERAHLNRRMAFEFERVRDFIILHYHLNRREEPLWQACRAMALPDSLAERIALFRSSGRVVRVDDELFAPVAWTQVMTGQGVVPASWDPLADALGDGQLAEFVELAARDARQQADSLPDHAAYLARTARAPMPESLPS